MLVCLTSRTNIPEAHTDAAQFKVSRSAVNLQDCPHFQCAADRIERTELCNFLMVRKEQRSPSADPI